eukprot:7778494-Karenia_brevis.AAC.1
MGVCWNCGKIGHKSAECEKRKVNEVEGEDKQSGSDAEKGRDATSMDIGTVWNLCPVEVSERPQEGEGAGEMPGL